MRKPNLFIVGAPRCGTTSLWTYLKGHPEIYMSNPKELYFFDADLREQSASLNSIEQYLEFFSAAQDQRRIGEASPSYLRSQRAPQAIKSFSPGAQIIIMLRNPVDVMYSLHSMALYNREPITDFEAALEADARRTGRERIGYREFTDFPAQVQRYFDLFGQENVYTIIYDDLKESSATVGQNTLRFLGVRLDFAAEFPSVNPNKRLRSTRLETMLYRPPRAFRAITRALAPQWLRSRARLTLSDVNRVADSRRPMHPELRSQLQKEFEPKVERLSKLLARDLSGWCKESRGENPRYG